MLSRFPYAIWETETTCLPRSLRSPCTFPSHLSPLFQERSQRQTRSWLIQSVCFLREEVCVYMCGLRLGTYRRWTGLERCLSVDEFGVCFLVNSYGFSKAWSVTGGRRDPRCLSSRVSATQDGSRTKRGAIRYSFALVGGIFCQTQKRMLSHLRLFGKPESQLEVSVHNSRSLAELQGTGISEQTPCQVYLCRQAMADD